MKIKARVGTGYKEELITELDRFVIETEKGEFSISFMNGKLRISERSHFHLAVQPQASNCLDVVAVEF